jgi:uncharacterized peroxidase-related enzyme
MHQRPHFLADPEETPAAKELFDDDVDDLGYVMNVSRLWAYAPEAKVDLFEALGAVTSAGGLSFRQRGVLVTATASTMGDSYCSLAWGSKLAGVADADTAAGVLSGDDTRLTPEEAAMARWARKVAADPNGTTTADVEELRDAGFDDREIFAITAYVAFRIAFSAVNDALGARPDAAYRTTAPDQVRRAVTFGRPMEEADQPV